MLFRSLSAAIEAQHLGVRCGQVSQEHVVPIHDKPWSDIGCLAFKRDVSSVGTDHRVAGTTTSGGCPIGPKNAADENRCFRVEVSDIDIGSRVGVEAVVHQIGCQADKRHGLAVS